MCGRKWLQIELLNGEQSLSMSIRPFLRHLAKCNFKYIGLARDMEPRIQWEFHFHSCNYCNLLYRLWLAMQVFKVFQGISYSDYRFPGFAFLIQISLRQYLASGLALFSPLSLGLGEHFASFHFISSLRVCGRETAGIHSSSTFGRMNCLFWEMGLVGP